MRRCATTGALWLLLGSASALAAGDSLPLPPEAAQLNQAAAVAETPAEAARLYARSIRLFPSNAPALHGLGLALIQTGRPKDALQVLRRLDSLSPGHPDVLIALGTALSRLPDLRRRDIREGLGLAERAANLQPESPHAWHLLSVLRHLDGDYAAAAEAARRAVELAAGTPALPRFQQQETLCNLAQSVFSPLD